MFFRRCLSAVMLSFRRPANVERIVASLRRSELVDDILVWNNAVDEPLAGLHPDADLALVRSSRDLGMHTRWAASLLARQEAVLMQDDDVLLEPPALRALFDAWWRDPDVIHAVWGRNPGPRGEYAAEDAEGEAEIALTRAMVFHRRHAGAALELAACLEPGVARLAERDGEDILFSYGVMRRTGRRQRVHRLEHALRRLPQPHAIGDRPDHFAVRSELMRACRAALGIPGAAAQAD
jgi:hypothetical protein